MITDIVIRFAKEIQEPNEIANFSHRYGITMDGVSAISWEAPNKPRQKFAENLLKKMIFKLSDGGLSKVLVIVDFSSLQPKSSIVRHKKTWGLLGERGVMIEGINNKNNHILDAKDGLTLTGDGEVDIESQGVIESLINTSENIYFIVGGDHVDMELYNEIHLKRKWMENVCNHDGIILMPLGFADEPSCEIVAFGKEKKIKPLHSYSLE